MAIAFQLSPMATRPVAMGGQVDMPQALTMAMMAIMECRATLVGVDLKSGSDTCPGAMPKDRTARPPRNIGE